MLASVSPASLGGLLRGGINVTGASETSPREFDAKPAALRSRSTSSASSIARGSAHEILMHDDDDVPVVGLDATSAEMDKENMPYLSEGRTVKEATTTAGDVSSSVQTHTLAPVTPLRRSPFADKGNSVLIRNGIENSNGKSEKLTSATKSKLKEKNIILVARLEEKDSELRSLGAALRTKECAVSAMLQVLGEQSTSAVALEAEKGELQSQIHIYAAEVMELQRQLTNLQSEHTEIVEQLQLADTTKALLEQEKEYYRGETEKLHSRLLLLGEEIALTPATLLFKRGRNGEKRRDCTDASEVVSSLTFAFDGEAAACGVTSHGEGNNGIDLPTLARVADTMDVPGCDRLLAVMDRLWQGGTQPDSL